MTDLEKRIVGTKKAREAGATGTVEVRRELSPGGNAHGLVWELARAGRKRVMIVGHEPDLSTLVQRLVGVVPDEGMLKAMVVGIKLTPTSDDVQGVGFTSKLRFVLHPKTLDWQRA
jgi:phosphohistidine phosphatase SixA